MTDGESTIEGIRKARVSEQVGRHDVKRHHGPEGEDADQPAFDEAIQRTAALARRREGSMKVSGGATR